MASSQKTSHLRLNHWSGADSPKKNDFNEDNRKLDEFAGSVPTREQLRPHLIYPAQCRYQDGMFHLSGLPEDIPECFTVRFAAPTSFAENETIQINGYRLTPCTCDFSPLPGGAFKATAIVTFEADLTGGRAFFRYGGAKSDGDGNPDQPSSGAATYNLFFGTAPPEDQPDGLFAQTSKPVRNIAFTPRLKRNGEHDPRCSFKMPEGRYSFTPFLYKGRIYCVGGRNASSLLYNTTYILDIETREWSTGANAPVNIADYMLGVIGNKAYLIGGRTPNSNKIIYSYNMDTDQWKEEGTLSSEITSLYFSGSVVVNGLIYLFFGVRNGAGASTQSYALDPNTCLMTELAVNLNGTTWAQAVEKDGIVYVVGRASTSSSYKSGILAYHIESNLWTTLYIDPQNRAYMGVCMVGNLIYLMGGLRSASLGETPMDDIRAYDIGSGLWSDKGKFLQRRHGIGVVSGPEGIYCLGGGISTTATANDALSLVDIIWSEEDTFPNGTLVVEYGAPVGKAPLYEARLGRTKEIDLTLNVRRVFYSDGSGIEEVPCMVNMNGAGWREVVS